MDYMEQVKRYKLTSHDTFADMMVERVGGYRGFWYKVHRDVPYDNLLMILGKVWLNPPENPGAYIATAVKKWLI
jgi:hypothetical protein